MKSNLQPLGDFYSFQKGLGYLGKFLKPSPVALVGLNSFEGGGGYKYGGEKEYSGPYKNDHIASPGDLFISTTDITQDGRVLASPFLMPNLADKYETVIFSGDIVKAVPKENDGLLPEFLYNVLRVKSFRQKAAYASTGSTVRRIPIEVLENLEVPVPPKHVQIAIAQQVGLLDRKIELNSRISIQLEQIAQTIFKSWFVDFDPVHSKARGEQPQGMDAETSALFPNSFEDSEIGPIPAGWAVGALSDQIQLISGGTPKTTKADYWNGGVPWYSVGDRPTSGPYFTSTSKNISQQGVEKSAVNLVGAHTTIISARGTVGKVCMAGMPTTFNQSCYGVEGGVSPFFTYLLVLDNVPRLMSISHGGTFDTITRETFNGIKIPLTPVDLQNKFHSLVKSLFEESLVLARQSQTLMALRDSLLPRLISGELEIPEDQLGE